MRKTQNIKDQIGSEITIKWGTSRAPDTYGYTTCYLYAEGKRITGCNGGGYDMRGTVIGSWIAKTFQPELHKLKEPFYGLTHHDPTYDPGKAVIGKDCTDRTARDEAKGMTVAEAEAKGESLGLERYQAIYSASSKVPTKRHRVASLDGGCGEDCMIRVLEAIGLTLERTYNGKKVDIYRVREFKKPRVKRVKEVAK